MRFTSNPALAAARMPATSAGTSRPRSRVALYGYDMAAAVERLNPLDVEGSLERLERHRLPATRAAQRLGVRNSHAAFREVANEALSSRRAKLRSTLVSTTYANDLAVQPHVDGLAEIMFRLNYKMVLSHVRSMTAKLTISEQFQQDVVAAAELGLISAIVTFDPARGSLERWAHWTILNEVKGVLRGGGLATLPTADPAYTTGRRRTDPTGSPADFATATSEIATDADPFQDLEASDAMQRLLVASDLTPREHYVMVKFYGLDGEERSTATEIGRLIGVSREAIRQARIKAERKLARAS